VAKILSVKAREILDSRGNPTVECELKTNKGVVVASVPSGASTGVHAALELRDGGKRYGGFGVLKAVRNVDKIAKKIKGMDPSKQREIDDLMIKLDGTQNKSNLGANAILSVSVACCKAAAQAKGLEVYEYISEMYGTKPSMPVPYFNVINGGKHAGSKLAIQEFMIAPIGAKTFSEALRIGSETYHALKKIIEHKYGRTAVNVGDEGGFAPPITKTQEAFDVIKDALIKARYSSKVELAIDAAATSFYKNGRYYIDLKEKSPHQLIEYYEKLVQKNPKLVSIEDPFMEEAFEDFAELNKALKIQIVGDDLTVTNTARLQKAIDKRSCNCLILKINQIGTLTEALNAATLCRAVGWKIMVSHRSGDTTDDFIADLAVGIGASQIKSGAPCRSERLAKYNRLVRIEELLRKRK
jgi:enolase